MSNANRLAQRRVVPRPVNVKATMFTVRLDPALYTALCLGIQAEQLSPNEITRRALWLYLKSMAARRRVTCG